jgi:large subunit ribosomal protein L5
MSSTIRLKKKYAEEVAPALMQQFGYKSVMQIPKLTKICINQGIGDATQDKKLVDNAMNELSIITGQKPVPTKARTSISNFKLREDMTIGVKVTLRGERMLEFLDRMITVVLMTRVLMVVEITPWVSLNKSFSLKLIWIR